MSHKGEKNDNIVDRTMKIVVAASEVLMFGIVCDSDPIISTFNLTQAKTKTTTTESKSIDRLE